MLGQRLARTPFVANKSSQQAAPIRPARQALVVCNSAVAAPATLPYKGVDGSDKGTQQLALKVAEETAKGLVHRYLVMVQQNARRVRPHRVLHQSVVACMGKRIWEEAIRQRPGHGEHTPISTQSWLEFTRIDRFSPQGTASTLTRSEVRGGGKKPYAQKGTGNARRGSSTSPLFPGGGVTFGPKVR